MKLTNEFYRNENVLAVASNLLGKVLFTNINDEIVSGIITETEAYNGVVDKASHAFAGRRTSRTEVMFQSGGVAYVYLCYGIHSLFNVVTGTANVPHAVLIRAIVPFSNDRIMYERCGKKYKSKHVFNGPGKLSKALGVNYKMTGIPLSGDSVWIEDRGIKIKSSEIETTPRIGVDYAGEDAFLPYRFLIKKQIVEKLLTINSNSHTL